MDPESIITQVKKENSSSNGRSKKGQPPGAAVSRRRSVLRSLLCCLGSGSDSRPPTPVPVSPFVRKVGASPPAGAPPTGAGYLLPPVRHQDMGKVCLVVDLDETLVHSSFNPIPDADFVVPVEIDGTVHQVYVLKRPHVDDFLHKIGDMFECVLFTASLAKYADPVADLLDKRGVFRSRLFRESCVLYRGNYVKDLERLGRDVRRVVIVDNSPASYIFHPENALPCKSWFDDMTDCELRDWLPLLETLSRTGDIFAVLSRERQTTASDAPTPEPPP